MTKTLSSQCAVQLPLVWRAAFLLFLLDVAAANYHAGDFVPAARRAQFHGVREPLEGESVAALKRSRNVWCARVRQHTATDAVARLVGSPLPQVRPYKDGASGRRLFHRMSSDKTCHVL